jgi:predicted GH43/DUF377 family glycosyl hydrolase
MRLLLIVGWLGVLASCGRYGDFGLPASPSQESFEWQWKARPEPVLRLGGALDVLNPSVVRWQGQYWNLYSVFEGRTWHTALALSADGLAWQVQGKVLSPGLAWESDYIAANGAVLPFGGGLIYVYQAGEKGRTVLGLARSADGRRWTKEPEPVLRGGARLSWDEVSLGDPYLIESGGRLYLFYLGEDRARRQRLGMASSVDGVHWTKQRQSPLLELGGTGDFDENGLGEPAVYPVKGGWVMLYTGRDRQEKRALGFAFSADGRQWVKRREPVLRGEQAWNASVVCDPTVLVEEGRVKVWFGGGDRPSPDERLNGQIGYGEFALAKE